MFINIYDLQLNRIGILQTWISMTWEERYNDLGSFTLEVVQDDQSVELIKPWRYCRIQDSDTIMVILSVQLKDGHLIAYGKSALAILERRICTDVVNKGSVAASTMEVLVEGMEAWDNFNVKGDSNIPDVYNSQKSGGTVWDYVSDISKSTDIGVKVIMEGGKLMFTCYKPALNVNARYSLDYGNLSNIAYAISDMDFRNIAYVAGQGEGANRVSVYVGNISLSGAERHEIYVDARDLQQEEDETLDAYKERLKARGAEKLLEQVHIDNVTFDIDEERANLGDIVRVKLPQFGVTKQVRVTGRTITSEYNNKKISLSVGESIL